MLDLPVVCVESPREEPLRSSCMLDLPVVCVEEFTQVGSAGVVRRS